MFICGDLFKIIIAQYFPDQLILLADRLDIGKPDRFQIAVDMNLSRQLFLFPLFRLCQG